MPIPMAEFQAIMADLKQAFDKINDAMGSLDEDNDLSFIAAKADIEEANTRLTAATSKYNLSDTGRKARL
jgi:hypothetical protein